MVCVSTKGPEKLLLQATTEQEEGGLEGARSNQTLAYFPSLILAQKLSTNVVNQDFYRDN